MATPKGPITPPLKILFLIYTGFNTLDVHGPLDVLCNYALRLEKVEGSFVVTTAAKRPQIAKDPSTTEAAGGNQKPKEENVGAPKSTPVPIKSWEFATTLADCTFDEVIPRIEKGEFDILMVPGSGGNYVNDLVKDAKNPDPIVKVVQTFMNYDNKRGDRKWMVSICTGAMVAGAAGCFEDRDATTHKAALSGLVDVCNRFGVPGNIIKRRWVYGGQADPAPGQKVPTNILSSGGISCGLDASLVLVREILGVDAAWAVANTMDYNWNVQVDAKNPKPATVKITPPDALRPLA